MADDDDGVIWEWPSEAVTDGVLESTDEEEDGVTVWGVILDGKPEDAAHIRTKKYLKLVSDFRRIIGSHVRERKSKLLI